MHSDQEDKRAAKLHTQATTHRSSVCCVTARGAQHQGDKGVAWWYARRVQISQYEYLGLGSWAYVPHRNTGNPVFQAGYLGTCILSPDGQACGSS